MKKKLFAFAPLLILSFSLLAQTPADCNLNLKNPIYTQTGILTNQSYAKANLPPEFKDVQYDLDCNSCSCTTIDACDGNPGSLIYDVYYPVQSSIIPLPAVILFHGGVFAECPGINQQIMATLCTALAERGFVVYNAEYRRGRLRDGRLGGIYTSVQHQLAAYRGLQDCKGAIRSIIKRQQHHNDPEFINDPLRD